MQHQPPGPLERRALAFLLGRVFLPGRGGGAREDPGLAHEAFLLRLDHGRALHARWFPCPGARGAAVLGHPDKRQGMDYFAREGWLRFLHDAGFHLLTFDHAGYGASRGVAGQWHEELAAAAREARRRAAGVPVHVVGLSLGAYAGANAAPRLEGVEALVLESPYPSFRAWLGARPTARVVALLDALMPRNAAALDALRNVAAARCQRILVAAGGADDTTAPHLSRAVAEAAPRERTRYLEVQGLRHLELFAGSAAYRQAVLETLGVPAAEAAKRAAAAPAQGPRQGLRANPGQAG